MLNAPFILCIGAAHWDMIGRTALQLTVGDDVKGQIERRPGGVALNIARALAGHGSRAALCSAVGDDAEGHDLIQALETLDVDCTHVLKEKGAETGHYIAIEDDRGDLFAAIADTAVLDQSSDAIVHQAELALRSARAIVLETNLAPAALQKIARAGVTAGVKIIANPVSPPKANRLQFLLSVEIAPMLIVNLAEANVLLDQRCGNSLDAATALQSRSSGTALVTDGPRPATLATPNLVITATPPAVPGTISVTGAGDALLSAFVASQDRGENPGDSFRFALESAANHVTNGRIE